MLYVVSTPIGNLKDMTYRAVEVLRSVDLIAAEDTRHTKILTNHYEIATPLTSYFEHNQIKKTDYLLTLLQEGKNVALVTDAGTPGISDPGYRIIALAREHDIPIAVVPGACALVAALSIAGLPTDRFCFEGFLPVKTVGRQKKLAALKEETRTIVFYESPHRLVECLADIRDVLDDPTVVCGRELTKKFEEVKRGRASDLFAHFSATKPKGECVLLVSLVRSLS